MAGDPRGVVLDRNRVTGEFQHFAVGQTETLALGLWHRNVFCSAPASGIDHAQLLAAERPAQYGARARAERRLVNVELIRVDGALHDVFTEPIDAGDEH